jgi:hypothetical protein
MIEFFRFLFLKEVGKEVSVCDVAIMYGDLLSDLLRQKINRSLSHGTVPPQYAVNLVPL